MMAIGTKIAAAAALAVAPALIVAACSPGGYGPGTAITRLPACPVRPKVPDICNVSAHIQPAEKDWVRAYVVIKVNHIPTSFEAKGFLRYWYKGAWLITDEQIWHKRDLKLGVGVLAPALRDYCIANSRWEFEIDILGISHNGQHFHGFTYFPGKTGDMSYMLGSNHAIEPRKLPYYTIRKCVGS